MDHRTWFQLAADGGRADFPLNLREKAARLEIRRNFFSNRVIDNWNMIPSVVKNARTVASFQAQLQKPKKELGFYHIVEDGRNNERRTLPERPQRSHWKINYN